MRDWTTVVERYDDGGYTGANLNTTGSLGRLTLNILLSFAEFERQMIADRTRDKMGAARRKGK